MKYHRIKIKSKNKNSRLIKFIAVLLISMIIFIIIDKRVSPLIKSSFTYQAKIYAMGVINKAIEEEMCSKNISYDNIVNVSKNKDGNITSIQANTIEINKLKSNITQNLTEKLSNIQKHRVTIPIGTIISGQIFSGRGPKINFIVEPMGFVQTDIYNNFLSAGINQTLHQIMLKTSVTVTVVFPGYSVTTDVVTNYCLAETVIVGYVPDSYVKFDGNTGYNNNSENDNKQKTKQ